MRGVGPALGPPVNHPSGQHPISRQRHRAPPDGQPALIAPVSPKSAPARPSAEQRHATRRPRWHRSGRCTVGTPTGTAVAHRGLITSTRCARRGWRSLRWSRARCRVGGAAPVRMRHPGPQPRRLDHHRRPLPRRAEPTQICARPRNASPAWPASPYTASPHTGPSPHDAPDSPSLAAHAPSVKGSLTGQPRSRRSGPGDQHGRRLS
jgi:hypothetical protein